MLHIVINCGTKKFTNMEKIKNLLTYERDSKFGLTRQIASLLIFLICCIRIIDNNPYKIAKYGAVIMGILIIFLIGKFAYEMISKYSKLKNISPNENLFRLFITISFGTLLIFNFSFIYQIMIATVLTILLFTRFVYK